MVEQISIRIPKSITIWLVASLSLVAMILAGCSDEPAPSPAAKVLPSATATAIPIPTPSATLTPTATVTSTPQPTATLTPEPPPTATPTPTPTLVPTAIPTATPTQTATPTATLTPEPPPTATPTPTPTLVPTAIPTATPTQTATPTATLTPEPPPTATPTPTPMLVPTAIPIATPTQTATPTATLTPEPTATPIATPTPEPTATPTPISEPVEIPDPNLRRALVRSLSKSSGAPIFRHELGTLRSFTVRYEAIGDLEGIQFATNLRRLELVEIRGSLVQGAEEHSPLDLSPLAALTSLTRLNLSQNKISDLLPLAGLTNLEYLSLEAVYIRWDESDTSTLDLSPLAGLTKLTDLALSYNNILDISPLAGLTALERLNISKNHISDISPLVGLTKLVNLNGQENRIVDVSPLSGLAALQDVVLPVNDISDVSPLAANAGLGSRDVLDVRTNPLNAESIGTHIPALQARGVIVSFDEVIVITDPQIYNGNVFVLPVSENLAAGRLLLEDYAERFYEHFTDEFDFLMFVPNLQPGQHEPGVHVSASYADVMNDVRGIGKSTVANNDIWGSAGRLQGVIDFGGYAIYGDRRSILFEGPTLHELMHRWANFIVPSSYGSHWGFSSANGNIGGFDIADLVDHGGGRYTAGDFGISGVADNVEPYSPIELYLAGFIPPGEVPDLWVAEDGEWLRDEEGRIILANNGHPMFTASQVRTYTIEDIIAEHGPRVPDSSQAQRDFRAAVILVVDQKHPATREVLETLSADVSWFSHPDEDESRRYNFYEATGGRGTIIMDDLSKFLKDRE